MIHPLRFFLTVMKGAGQILFDSRKILITDW